MNGAAHRFAGGLVGGGAAVFTGRGQTGLEVLVEAISGAGGGIIGAKIPDWAEPATNSWHRGRMHSVAAGAASLKFGIGKLQKLQRSIDQRIVDLRLACAMAQTPGEALWSTLEIVVWLALAALLKCILAGYLSHLALDATTPRSIPLI